MKKSARRVIAILLVLGAILLGVAACSLTRAGYETAPYEVDLKDSGVEIRIYPELAVVQTPMGNRNGRDGSFMRLFGYIQGENETGQKIAMTTPVFMTDDETSETATMSFVLPKEVAEQGAPESKEKQVQLATLPAGKYAVYRFSGRRTDARIAEIEKILAAWVEERGMQTSGDFFTAGYDPPFTPPGLQRNEVLVPISE